jgi:hypothetical protein
MGVPTSEVGYTSATTGREDHEVHKGHVVALAQNNTDCTYRHAINEEKLKDRQKAGPHVYVVNTKYNIHGVKILQ